MRPLDPRLLRHASAMRVFLAGGALLGLLQTLSIVGFAWFLSQLIAGIVGGAELSQLGGSLLGMAASVTVRALAGWGMDATAFAGAARVKSQLRRRALTAMSNRGPGALHGRSVTTTTVTLGAGLDALDAYFSRYLPQLILTVIAMPILVAIVLVVEPLSGIIVIIVIPLIPVFMVLIGLATRAVQQRQWASLQAMAGAFLDLVGGLATLKIFGRARRQSARIEAVTDGYRRDTMAVLRVTFLSGFVLELAGSLSVALVAVSIGLRMLEGGVALGIGLFVLILAPEIFLPLRQVGAQFHAAADGIQAAEELFELMEEGADNSTKGGELLAYPSTGFQTGEIDASLRLRQLRVAYGGNVVIDGVDASFAPGTITAITGASGAGKSSLLGALVGTLPFSGQITLGETEVTVGSRDWLSWAGQRAVVVSGSVAENVALGASHSDPTAVTQALIAAGASELDPERPLRSSANGDSGLSGGQQQRLAVARAFYRQSENDCAVLALDEPSSALDAVSEERLLNGLRQSARAGAIVIVVTHRAALISGADVVLDLGAPTVTGTLEEVAARG